jgi:ribosomal protein L44E
VKITNTHEFLFINKIKHVAKSDVRSNVESAFDRIPACVRSSDVCSTAVASQCHVRSSVGVAFECTQCGQTHVTAHGARLKR